MRPLAKTTAVPNFTRLAISLAAITVAASAFAVQPARAQNAADTARPQIARVAYDDRTVQSFAAAAAAVLTLRNQYYPRIRAAEIANSTEKAERLYDEMLARMQTAISGSGFSEDQYRAISSAAKIDNVLRERINAVLQGKPPAQRQVRNVTRVTPPAPQVAPAPANNAPATSQVSPPQTAAISRSVTPPADDGGRARLEAELHTANAERERFRAEQRALQEQMQKLERQLSAVKAQDTTLRQQLTAAKTKAQAKQQANQAELGALVDQMNALKDELSSTQLRDATLIEQLAVEKSEKDARLAAFREEVKRLADRLASAQASLDGLAGDLDASDPATPAKPAFEALKPLNTEPTSIDRVIAKVEPQYARQLELDSEIARIQQERQRRAAERSRLQTEIAELSRDLATTYQAMAELIGEPAPTVVAAAELDLDNANDALDFSQTTAQLFTAAPAQFSAATAEGQTGIQLDEPRAMGLGDSLFEQIASAAAGGAELETDVTPTLRINPPPETRIVTTSASAETPARHRVVRDDRWFQPQTDLDIDATASSASAMPDYSGSVSGGAEAYRAADYRRAYEIWSALAESGNRSAQFHLGALYFEGRGTGVDYGQAYLWLRIAAHRGDRRATALIATVAEFLTRTEIGTLEDRAQEWLDKRSIEVTQAPRARSGQL